MSNFALDVGSSQGDIISSLNYALSNLGQGAGTTANVGNVLTVNTTTGNITNGTGGNVVSYLYQYMDVAYANTQTGGGFTSNSQNQNYFGLRNTNDTTWDTNPVDYIWFRLQGGFGTTKSLYYQTSGGRQINFVANTGSPGYYYRTVADSTPINLDNVTTTQTVYTTLVYQRANTTPATPTGGTYNFGTNILTPPTGWSANIPPGNGNLYVFSSQNTFQSSQNFVNGPTTVWTFPTIFSANGANGTNGANGAIGANGVSSYDYTVYTTSTFLPNTPLANTGSWNFTTSIGVPPQDPNYTNNQIYITNPYWNLPQSNISFTNNYSSNTVKIYSNTVSNVSYSAINNTYYTLFANTYAIGNVNVGYAKYCNPNDYGYSVGNAYVNTFTVTGNTAYVDIMLIGAGGDGDSIGSTYPTHPSPPLSPQPYLQTLAAGNSGNVLIGSNIALTTGTYTIYHGAGVSTTITGPGGTWTADAGTDGVINGTSNIAGGSGASISYIGNSSIITGNIQNPTPTLYTNTVGNLTLLWTSRAKASNGGNGVTTPWYNEVKWIGSNVGNVAYFGGGGASSSSDDVPSYGPALTLGIPGTGGAGQGFAIHSYTGSVVQNATNAQIATGSGGGGGPTTSSVNNHSYPNPYGYATGTQGYNAYGSPGVVLIRLHNPISITLPRTVTWSNIQPSANATSSIYSSTAFAFTNNIAQTVTNLTWQPSSQISGPTGNAGPRGFVPMAYVSTSSDPTSYTTGQYTYAFSANRANVATPIGTGYSPIDGDVAQFVYAPTNTITVKTYNATANTWSAVNGQVISGNVFVTGSVNATALNANDVYTLNLRGGAGNVGDFNSAGFWMQSSTGDARMAGNTSIGNSLTVGANAQIGGNLTIGNNLSVGTSANIGANLTVGTSATIGANLTVGTSANIGANLTVGTNATIGNNLIVGTSALIGNNLGVGNLAVIGNQLTVGANATIGNNLTVGNAAVVGNYLSVGTNASIGNNLTVGNNLGIGNNAVIGNSLYIGNNAQIGGNLAVAGLVTAGNLNTNTVNTTTMVPNAATATAGYQGTGYQINSPTIIYGGFDGTYYIYQTANLVPRGTSVSCTTANVVNVVSGYIDVYGVFSTTVNSTPQMFAQIYRVIGSNVTPISGTFTTTPAYNTVLAGTTYYTTQSLLPYRLSEISIIDSFTLPTPPTTVNYYWVFGSSISQASNTAPTISYDGITSYSLSVTNYRR